MSYSRSWRHTENAEAGGATNEPDRILYPAGFRSRPRNGGLMTTCTQPGCTGTIVDDYCDVCGSPASTPASVHAGAAAAAPPPAPDTGGGPAALPQTMACAQPGCAGTIVDDYCDVCGSPASTPASVAAKPAAKEPPVPAPAKPAAKAWPAPGKPAAKAPLPPAPAKPAAASAAPLPSAALTTAPGMRACTQPGCTGTIVDDYCDVCGSPASAKDSVPAKAAAPPPTAPAKAAAPPPTAPAKAAAPPPTAPAKAAAPPPTAPAKAAAPAPAARPGLTAVRRAVGVAAVLFLLACAVAFYRIAPGSSTSGSPPSTAASSSSSPAPTSVGTQSAPTASRTPGAAGSTGSGSAGATIQLENPPDSGNAFEIVRIRGTYPGGPDTFLQVQRREAGKWLSFPMLPTKTDQSGQFTAYVELGPPGRYRLRLLDPESGAKSKSFVLVIKG